MLPYTQLWRRIAEAELEPEEKKIPDELNVMIVLMIVGKESEQ